MVKGEWAEAGVHRHLALREDTGIGYTRAERHHDQQDHASKVFHEGLLMTISEVSGVT
jgi:hypothetical protein